MSLSNFRLSRLLDSGFYPAELPPSFRTIGFGNVRETFEPPEKYVGATGYFEGATFRGNLRTFGIINPINYFNLSKFIAEFWPKLVDVYKLSSCSGSRPKFPARKDKSGRAILTAPLAHKRKSQSHLASSFPVILSLDINKFYGSGTATMLPEEFVAEDGRQTDFMLCDEYADPPDKPLI